jgi:hypothetical protein
MKPILKLALVLSSIFYPLLTQGQCSSPQLNGIASPCQGYTASYYGSNFGVQLSNFIWPNAASLAPVGGVIVGGGTTADDHIVIQWTQQATYNLIVTATDPTNCTSSDQMTIHVGPPPPTTFTGNFSVCYGPAQVYTAPTGMASYFWSASGGSISGSNSSSTVSVAWQNYAHGFLSLTGTTTTGCPVSILNKQVDISSIIVPTLSPPYQICTNSPTTFTTESGMSNYSWSVTGATILSGQGTNSVVLFAADPNWGSASITISYTSPSSCTVNPSTSTIPITYGPTPSLVGPTSVCTNGVQYSYTTDGGKSGYNWTVTSGSIVSGSGTNSISVLWNTSGSPSIGVKYNDAVSGCTSRLLPQTVTTLQTITPSLSGGASVCQTNPTYFSTDNFTSGFAINWSVSPDGNLFSGGTTSDHTVGYMWSTPGTKTVSVTVTGPGYCSNTTSRSIDVTPYATAVITGPATACLSGPGNNPVSYSTTAVGTSYTWSASNGTITGNNANAVSVNWNAVGNQTLYLNYVASNGCTAFTSTAKTVAVTALPIPSLTGPTNPCEFSAGNVYTTDPLKTGYVWTIPNGATIAAGGGSTNNSVTIDWDQAYGIFPITVRYTDPATGCAGTSNVLNVNVRQGISTPWFTGNPACLGPNNFYTAGISGMASYTWAISPGGTITNGAGTDHITVNWASSGVQWISINYTNSFGCTASAPGVQNITVNPTTTPSIGGSLLTCGPGPTVYYTESNASAYWWQLDATTYTSAGYNFQWGTWSPGTHTVRVKYVDQYGCQSNTTTVSVNAMGAPTPQTIAFPTLPTKIIGDPPFNPGATASSGLGITYSSSNTAVATVSGVNVNIIGKGEATIFAYQPGGTCIAAAPNVGKVLTVNGLPQTITFGVLPAKNFNDPAFTLGATASSGLAVSYTSSNTAVATVTGNTVTIVGGGSTSITANQSGNATYDPAAAVAQILNVNAINQTISFAALPIKTFADPAFNLSSTASSGLPVSFASLNTTVATVSGTTVTIVGGGTATIVASQAGNSNYNAASSVNQTLTVNPAGQTITFGTIPAKTCGISPFDPGATASSGLPISYTSSNAGVATASGNVLTVVAPGSSIITATQTGNANYLAASSVSSTLTVNQVSQTITVYGLPTKTYGDGPFTINASASSGLPISFSSANTSVATVSGSTISIVGAGSTTITATQVGNACVSGASVGQVLTVNQASQSISFSLGQTSYCGTGSISLGATSATSGINPITYSSSNTSVITISGSTANRIGYGDATITASQAASANYNAASVGISVHIASSAGSISTSSGANICHTGGTTITAGSGSNYLWSTGQTSSSIFVSDVGTYTVNYTNSSGCAAFGSINITRSGTNCTNLRIAQEQSDETSDFDPNHVFGISPNPADRSVLVVLSEIAKQDNFVEVYDMLGRNSKSMIIEKGLKEKTMNVEDLNAGIYLINIKDNVRERQRRLVIMRK